ncbi:MAG: FAD/NAD(P)-binding protein [Gemmobacter sp.]
MTGPLRHPVARSAGRRPHVAIIGGGASGVLMALHLLTRTSGRPDDACRVTLLEGANSPGCGLAYSTSDPDHLLNTRVQNMSAFPDDPDHFQRWLATQGRPARPMDFVTRATYGRYLGALLQDGIATANRRLSFLRQSCLRVEPRGQGYRLHLGAGAAVLDVDAVILATGHALPAAHPLLRNAWQPIGGLDPDAAVVILGTGLSMVDQVLSLLVAGHRGQITAVSRRGLLPREHAPTVLIRLDLAELPLGQPLSAWLRWLRALARQSGDWRGVVDGLRPHLRRVWSSLPRAERRRFLRHAVSWWDVHRHRIPPASAGRLREALASGQLVLRRGRFRDVARQDLRLALTFDGLGAVTADIAIDCRGIRHDPAEAASPLIRDMLGRGIARVDPLRIGLDIAPDCRVIAGDGTPHAGLFAIGPVSRAAFWEITAIPDIREQTMALAERLDGLHTGGNHWAIAGA